MHGKCLGVCTYLARTGTDLAVACPRATAGGHTMHYGSECVHLITNPSVGSTSRPCAARLRTGPDLRRTAGQITNDNAIQRGRPWPSRAGHRDLPRGSAQSASQFNRLRRPAAARLTTQYIERGLRAIGRRARSK